MVVDERGGTEFCADTDRQTSGDDGQLLDAPVVAALAADDQRGVLGTVGGRETGGVENGRGRAGADRGLPVVEHRDQPGDRSPAVVPLQGRGNRELYRGRGQCETVGSRAHVDPVQQTSGPSASYRGDEETDRVQRRHTGGPEQTVDGRGHEISGSILFYIPDCVLSQLFSRLKHRFRPSFKNATAKGRAVATKYREKTLKCAPSNYKL